MPSVLLCFRSPVQYGFAWRRWERGPLARFGFWPIFCARAQKADEPSPAQAAQRLVFREAQNYAAKVLSDPLKRKWYQRLGAERNRPPNTLLVSNFLTPPVIDEIELSQYHGSPGDEISILATDAIEVVDVTVAIRDVTGSVLEQAPARKDHGIWIHRATASLTIGQPVTITVTAQNRAGSKASESRSFP